MAAPTKTVWGSAVNNKGKIGVYTAVSTSDTQVSVTVQIWIATRYSAYDSSNKFYYDHGTAVTAAATSQGSISFNHSVNSSWSDSNQTKIYEKTYTHNRGTTAQTYKIYAKLSGVDWVDGTMYANSSYTVPALKSYTVTYNANNGTGAPAAQTKWHEQTLTLSSTKPTRTGYKFRKWLSSAQNQEYDPGDFYGHNESTTMTAQWTPNTYTVTYDANGGTGAPAAQTKTHGTALTLSSAKPTRAGYNFLGWSETKDATTATYAAGGSYTKNAKVTLYAVWKLAYILPEFTDISIYRCDASGNADDFGEYINIAFTVNSPDGISMLYGSYKAATETTWHNVTLTYSGTSVTISQIVGDGAISTDAAYSVKLHCATGKAASAEITRTVPAASFPIDALAGGTGVSIGAPATKANTFDVHWPTDMNGNKITNMAEPTANQDAATKYYADQKLNTFKNSELGVAKYTGNGENSIDPDTTTEFLILTNNKTPMVYNNGTAFSFMYIITFFYGARSNTRARAQIAIPYSTLGSMYHRYYYNGSWSAWRRHVNEDEL